MKIIDFLKWCYWDYKNPREDLPQGIRVYCSDTGTGKTLSVIEYLSRVRNIYPGVKIFTNIDYFDQDGSIETVEDMVLTPHNSVLFIDEINLILNSHAWRDVDPAILQPLTQHRKLAKQIVATAQSFKHINAQFRDFTNEIIEVHNLRRRWFFQKAYHRSDYRLLEGKDDEYKKDRCRWMYSFIADNDLFDSYDTYKIVEKFKSSARAKVLPERTVI